MSKIVKQDTNGVKPLLAVGELGYDNYPSGGDIGRVYVGTGSSNIAQAKKSEVVVVDGKVDTHVARIDNPHGVTKGQVGLGNVDNTSDIEKPISIAAQTALDTKQATLVSGTNIKTIEGRSIVGSGNIDLSKNDVGLSNVDNTADTAKVVASAGKWTTARLINGSSVDGASDVTTSKWGTSRSITIGGTAKSVDGSSNITWTLGEIGAIGTDSPAFTGTPTATTAAVGTNTTQLATTAFVNAEIANDAIPRITSIDNAIPKFDGTTGELQDSGVVVDDKGNVGIGVTPSAWYQGHHIQTLYSAFGENSSGYAEIQNNSYEYASNAYKYIASGLGASKYTTNFGNHQWFTAPSGTAGNVITWTNAMNLDLKGNLLLTSGTGVLGYGTGAGGVVIQLTSKSTSVTLNKPTGLITTHNSALAAGASISFVVNNNLVDFSTTFSYDWASASYEVYMFNSTTGSFEVKIKNVTAGSLSQNIDIQFNIIKGAIS